jgi:hypothetical protein
MPPTTAFAQLAQSALTRPPQVSKDLYGPHDFASLSPKFYPSPFSTGTFGLHNAILHDMLIGLCRRAANHWLYCNHQHCMLAMRNGHVCADGAVRLQHAGVHCLPDRHLRQLDRRHSRHFLPALPGRNLQRERRRCVLLNLPRVRGRHVQLQRRSRVLVVPGRC